MNFNLDEQLSKITGGGDYIKQLSQITGDPFMIEHDFYKKEHQILYKCDGNIYILLERILALLNEEKKTVPKEFQKVAGGFATIHCQFDIRNKTFIKKKRRGKKPVEIIAEGYSPVALFNSVWFKQIKFMEKEINHYLFGMLGQKWKSGLEDKGLNWGILKTELEKNPSLGEDKTILSLTITAENLFNLFIDIWQYSNIIINILMEPMYDVRKKITQNDSVLKKVLRNSAALTCLKTNQNPPMETLISLLDIFIRTKYKVDITGKSKYYIKMLLGSLSANKDDNPIDNARLLEVIDNIDFEQINGESKLRAFGDKIKGIIKRLANGEKFNAEEEITSIRNIELLATPNSDKSDLINSSNPANDIDLFSC
jgi:hypothetical protein